jgi:transposase
VVWKNGKPYAQDLRDRVFLAAVATADEAIPVGQIAERLSVSISYVSKVLSRHRLTGERAARPQRCHLAAQTGPVSHGNPGAG